MNDLTSRDYRRAGAWAVGSYVLCALMVFMGMECSPASSPQYAPAPAAVGHPSPAPPLASAPPDTGIRQCCTLWSTAPSPEGTQP